MNPGVETTRNKKSEGLKFQNSHRGFPQRQENHKGGGGVSGSSKGRSGRTKIAESVMQFTKQLPNVVQGSVSYASNRSSRARARASVRDLTASLP